MVELVLSKKDTLSGQWEEKLLWTKLINSYGMNGPVRICRDWFECKGCFD